MFCVTVSIILSSKHRWILLLFVLEFVMNHKNETGNITTEKSFSTEVAKLVRASYENNWKIDVEPLSFVYWAHPPAALPRAVTSQQESLLIANDITSLILLHEKFLQFDRLRGVVFQLKLKYVHVKITNPVRVVV